jgi:plastocyanin
VRLRRRYVPLIAVLGIAAAVLPAIASSETTPTIEAVNKPGGGYYGEETHAWSPTTATIGAGGVVKFSNPYNTTYHGLKFTGGSAGATPNCSGIPTAASEEIGALHWEGQCTFSKPGTYTFVCTVHPSEMRGTITVNPDGTTTTTTTTPTTPTTPVESAGGSPFAGGPSLRSSQRGDSVKGSLVVSKAGAGDRLEVDLLASTAALAKTGHTVRVRVGRYVRAAVAAGRLSFSVELDARARRTLRRRHRLALSVRIALAPFYGEPTTLTRAVVEHG